MTEVTVTDPVPPPTARPESPKDHSALILRARCIIAIEGPLLPHISEND
jgi:hypothetical protein